MRAKTTGHQLRLRRDRVSGAHVSITRIATRKSFHSRDSKETTISTAIQRFARPRGWPKLHVTLDPTNRPSGRSLAPPPGHWAGDEKLGTEITLMLRHSETMKASRLSPGLSKSCLDVFSQSFSRGTDVVPRQARR